MCLDGTEVEFCEVVVMSYILLLNIILISVVCYGGYTFFLITRRLIKLKSQTKDLEDKLNDLSMKSTSLNLYKTHPPFRYSDMGETFWDDKKD